MKKIFLNFKELPTLLKLTIFISLSVFISSLTQPAFTIDRPEDPTAYSNSLSLFLTGWMSLLGGGAVPFLIWLANPLYFLAIFKAVKKKGISLYFSIVAAILGLIFSQLNSIMTSESGSTSKIMSLGLGFRLWLASFMILSAGLILNFVSIRKPS